MTISPKTIKKMRSMKDEGYINKEIAKKCRVSTRSVGKKLGENNRAESASQNQLHSTSDKNMGDMQEELEIIELRHKVESELNKMMQTIEDEDEDVLMEQLEYLWDKLENATALKEIREIEELISEDSDLLKKFCDAVNRWWEKERKSEEERRKEAEEERKVAEEKRKKAEEIYNSQYNWLKSKIVEVIEGTNAILPADKITQDEIERIITRTLPYDGTPIYRLAKRKRFRDVLESYVCKSRAEILSKRWKERIYSNA